MLRYILTASFLSIATGILFHLMVHPLVWTVLFVVSAIFFGATTASLLWLNGKARTRFQAALAGSLVAIVVYLTQATIIALTFKRLEGSTEEDWLTGYIVTVLALLLRTALPGIIAAFIGAWTIGLRRVIYIAAVINGVVLALFPLSQGRPLLFLLAFPLPMIAAGITARIARRSDPLRRIGPAMVESIPAALLSALVAAGMVVFVFLTGDCKTEDIYCLSHEVFRRTTLYGYLVVVLTGFVITGLIGGLVGALTVRRAKVTQNA